VSADELARIRRSLLRLLDVIDQGTKSSDGPAVRIARPSRSDKIPREIAALMRVITEMRNASEYQDKQLSDSESFALRSSWNAILEWTAKKNITFKQ
jgi:hypothetical protein